jgi:hypothetical protein
LSASHPHNLPSHDQIEVHPAVVVQQASSGTSAPSWRRHEPRRRLDVVFSQHPTEGTQRYDTMIGMPPPIIAANSEAS